MNAAKYISEYGIHLFFVNGFTRVLQRIKAPKQFLDSYTNYKHKIDERYLLKHYFPINEELKISNKDGLDSSVFTIWWQGEDKAPDIVQRCIQSVRRNSHKRVIVIDEDNLNEYLDIPTFILDKAKRGIISRAHFADIVRFALLYCYGGVWIDATCFLSDVIPDTLFEYDFYSLKGPFINGNSLGWQWTSFFMEGKKGNVVCKKMLQFYYKYWADHEEALTYLILDCYLTVLLENDKTIRKVIEEIPSFTGDVFALEKLLRTDVIPSKMDSILGNSYIHKATYKNSTEKYISNMDKVIRYMSSMESE